MKLYIPAPGDHLKLTAPWTFALYVEWMLAEGMVR